MKTGQQQGIAMLAVGILFTLLHFAAVHEGYVFPVILMCIPTFAVLGIGFLFFPGQAKGKEARKNPAVFWNGGSKTDKTVWVISFIIGLGIGLYLFFTTIDLNNFLNS